MVWRWGCAHEEIEKDVRRWLKKQRAQIVRESSEIADVLKAGRICYLKRGEDFTDYVFFPNDASAMLFRLRFTVNLFQDCFFRIGEAEMTIDREVPTTHPYPAYYDLYDHEDDEAMYNKAAEQKLSNMARFGTLPKLQSELDDIVYCHAIDVVMKKVGEFLVKMGYVSDRDYVVVSYEQHAFNRICFKKERQRDNFIRQFPKWKVEPQGWVWGAQSGENKFDAKVVIEPPKPIIPIDGQHQGDPILTARQRRMAEPAPKIGFEPFEIATGKPLKPKE